MTHRERTLAVLRYENYDQLPIVHFGFWSETIQKWHQEGHLTEEEARTGGDSNVIGRKLGFDLNWNHCASLPTGLLPGMPSKVLEHLPDGSRKVLNGHGVVVIQKSGATGIPPEVDYLLKDRAAWEEHFLPRLQFNEQRQAAMSQTVLDRLGRGEREEPLGIHCGSLYGTIRNWLTLLGSAYLQADDPELFTEIIDTVGDLCYQCTKWLLEQGAQFDFGHFWEDICFKSGPLVHPDVFREQVGPHYKRITKMLNEYGIDVVSLDCDGKIDALVPIWFENGVNTMFPIEVGTWEASIQPWREQYGRGLLGVGGMDKKVFAHDYASVDAEVERLKPLVDLGGYLPCPDHRIPPDANWESVQYYCERMRKEFG